MGIKRAYFYINHDKVSNTKSYSSDNIKIGIPIENKHLINILFDSYEKIQENIYLKITANK